MNLFQEKGGFPSTQPAGKFVQVHLQHTNGAKKSLDGGYPQRSEGSNLLANEKFSVTLSQRMNVLFLFDTVGDPTY